MTTKFNDFNRKCKEKKSSICLSVNFTIFSFHKTKGHKCIGGAMFFPPSQNFFYTQSEYLIIVCHVQSVIFVFFKYYQKFQLQRHFLHLQNKLIQQTDKQRSTKHIKLNIEQHEPHNKARLNSGTPEW